VRAALRSSPSAVLPVFVIHAGPDEDRELATAQAEGRIGPETLVVVIRDISGELAALDGSTDAEARA
jgi:hypothetical protein